VQLERTTFSSEEEMRAAMQGRYAIERDYEDIYIEGDTVTLTYLAYSHYNREYAERYGYNYDEEDAVYEDTVIEWDYRHGVMKTYWMGDIIVDKNGDIRRGDYSYSTFYRTDAPRPEPVDPATLDDDQTDAGDELTPEEEEEVEVRNEELEETQAAAAAAAEAESSEGE
jgi:hypothetical protein